MKLRPKALALAGLLSLVPMQGLSKVNKKERKSASAHLGFGPGGLGLGGEYQKKYDKYADFGGYVHYYSAGDRVGGLALGGFIRPRFKKKDYELSFLLGAGIFNLENTARADTHIGTILGIGVFKKYNRELKVGFTQYSYYSFIGEQTGRILESGMLSLTYSL